MKALWCVCAMSRCSWSKVTTGQTSRLERQGGHRAGGASGAMAGLRLLCGGMWGPLEGLNRV